tara:strand:+ start:10959 stop:13292 length:2334 start_codon:yes stop_codon:yes gene_type:complete
MSDKKQSSLKNLPIYESVFLILFLSIGFIQNFEAIDKVAPQWLSMAILNFFCGIFIIRNQNVFDKRISAYFKSWITILYALFILWAGLSFFYAINPTEVVVNFTRQFNVFFMYSNMVILLSSIKNKIKFFGLVFTIILAIELYFVFYQAIEMLNDFGAITSGRLKGVTANRNIAAFSIALKIPFVLGWIVKSNTRIRKILGLIIITLSITALSMIQSRASYIAVGLIVVMFPIVPFFFFKNENTINKFKTLLFVILPLFLSITINQVFFASKGANAITRASSISLSTNDGSVNQRLRYYNHVLTHMKLNPLFGVGFGNWKFKSIDYDKKNMTGYTVPYHAHSDFIQIGAELGILGFIFYAGIFLISIFYSLKLLAYKELENDDKLFIYLVLTGLGVYFIDANLNFPIARPQVNIIWALSISSICYFFIQKSKINLSEKNDKKIKWIYYIILAISIPSIFVSVKIYDSLKNQMILLNDFNTNSYNAKIQELEAMNMSIPNVTVTTIPLKSLKARYYLNNNQYDKALQNLGSTKNSNPYLFFTDFLKSKVYEKKGNIDSAYYHSKKAFFGLPNNTLHSANFVKLAMQKKDLASIEEAADQLIDSQSALNWQNIITAYIDLTGSGNQKLMKLTNRAVELFPNNYNFLLLRKLAHTDPFRIKKGVELAREALKYFNQKNYQKAKELYLLATKEDPLEFSYYENAASCFYQLKEFGNSMLYSSKVIYGLNPGTGKSEYIHAISKISTGDVNGGCKFISLAIDLNYKEAFAIKEQFCKDKVYE